jgi:hypothetical protein
MIIHPSFKYKAMSNLHNWSIRDKEKYGNLIESMISFIPNGKNPYTNSLVTSNLVGENQILIIEKKYVQRLYNYSQENSFLWPENNTLRLKKFLRESVGIPMFASVCLFECNGLLNVISPN